MPLNPIRLLVTIIFFVGFLYCSPLKGQVKDAGLWTSAGFEFKVVKKITASISEEVRFNENISEVGMILTDLGMSYKYNKHFQFSVGYRYSQKREVEEYYSIRHRFNADIKYEKKIKPFEIKYRIRLQGHYSDIGRASDGGIPEYYLRNKLAMNLDLEKSYSPYISLELFSSLNYPRISAFEGIRTTAGVEYKFSKHHKIDLFYLVQKELNVSNPETDFVVGLGYFFKL
jgi:hypothetical protein